MAIFSVGTLEDGEGSSSRSTKRRRTNRQAQSQSQSNFTEENIEEEDAETVGAVEDHEEELGLEDCEEDEEDEVADEEEEYEGEIGANSSGNGERADLAEPCRTGSISVTLTDPDVFDCTICFESLTIPVFQCENGHIACSSCCTRIMNKCPSCCSPIGYNRCRAIEKVLESVKTTCQNSKYGCKETVSYSKKYDHEKMCDHTPCSCPLSDCDFVGSSHELYTHFRGKHEDSAVQFVYNSILKVTIDINEKFRVFQEERDGVIFILNNDAQHLGNLISVSCIAPSWKRGYFYDILARPEGSTLRFQAFTKNIENWVENPPSTGYLLVPSGSFCTCGQLKLELCVWRPGVSLAPWCMAPAHSIV